MVRLETTVTRKGQVTIPVDFRRKYGIAEGTKIEVTDSPQGLLLRPVPEMSDLAGVDSGKYTHREISERLDRLRQRWR